MTDFPTTHQTTLPGVTRIAQAWNRLSWLHQALAGLVIFRLFTALLIMFNILPLPADMRFGWHLHHGGDQDIMFRLAQSLLTEKPVPAVVGLGQPLVMLPFIALLHPYYYTDIVIPLVLINGFLLAGLSILCLGLFVKHITGSERSAIWSAAVWSMLPLIAYLGLFWNPSLRGVIVPMLGWLNGLSDGPATFFVLLAAMLLAQSRESTPSVWRMVLFGMALGVAITFRVHIVFMLVVMLGYTLLQHGWRNLIVALIGSLIAYIPQAWYNWVTFRLIFTTGYLSIFRLMKHHGVYTGEIRPRPLSEILPTMPFSPQHIMQLGDQLLAERWWLAIPVLIGTMTLLGACLVVWKRNGWRTMVLLIIMPMAYLLPMSMAWPFREDPIRFSIPAMPYLIALGTYALWHISQHFKIYPISRES